MQTNLGLGLAALGRPGYINLGHAEDLASTNYGIGAMRKHAHSVLDTAWGLDVRYFDAARSYGRAEEFLSTWLETRNIAPTDVTIGSKWGYTYTAAWRVKTAEGIQHEVKRHELLVLQSQFQQSMKHLSKHLDLYQIHSATLESGVLENKKVLQCLNGLRKSGIKIGLSVSGPNQSETIEKALTIQLDGERLFESVQATWNLLETSTTNAFQNASDAGLQVIVKEALANGRLTDRNESDQFAKHKAELKAIATEYNSSIDAVALAAVMNQKWATTVLSGAACSEHLQSNAQASTIQWSEELQTRLKPLVQSPIEYWNERSKLAWN